MNMFSHVLRKGRTKHNYFIACKAFLTDLISHIFALQLLCASEASRILTPDTEWPFSADSYAGLRLLDLHGQQKTTNMLLTMSTRVHIRGWGSSAERNLNGKVAKNELKWAWWWKENPASDALQVNSLLALLCRTKTWDWASKSITVRCTNSLFGTKDF